MTLAAAVSFSLAMPLTIWPTAASAQARYYYRDQNGGYQTRSPYNGRSRTQRQSITLPRNGEPVAIKLAQPTVPRPPGSNARVCANQTIETASYRIDACAAIIASGRLRGEALGVAYALRGLAYLDRGDIPHAIGDLNRAVDLAPNFAPAYQNRGNAWFARGSYGQALADYDKTIELDPNSPSPYVNRAAVRRDLGFTEGAFADYAKAIGLRPNHTAAYSGRGQLYLRQKDYAHAIADFDNAVRLNPSAANHMLRAQAREAAGDLDAALRDYRQAARLEPRNVAPLNAMAAAFNKKRDYDNEIAVLDRAVTLDQNRSLSYRMRAESYRDKGERKQAYADINRALKLSWTVNGLKVRGNLRLEDGDLAGALHDADAILKIEGDNADAIALRAMTYAAKKDYAKALPDLDRAIEADGNNALALAARGQIYAAKKDDVRALADLSRAIDLHLAKPAPYRARAAIHTAKNEPDKAIADLDQAIKLDPTPAEPYFERAALYKAKGNADLAMAGLNDGLARQPDNLAALNARAEMLMQAKDYGKAIEDFGRIAKLDPRNARVYYLRGRAYEHNQQRDQAIADYQTALTRDRKMADARKALASAMAQAKAEAKAKAKAEAQAKTEAAKQARLAARQDKTQAKTQDKTQAKTNAKAGAPERPDEIADANGNARTVPLPAARPETVALNAPGGTPDTTASIPADAGRTVTPQAQPEREAVQKQIRKPVQKHRETARERTKREYLARQYARERAAYLARERLRQMSPAEKRRLYFENLERQRRRDTRFTDIWR
jgi:tetratricopeptide (TPR) repeat protein